MSETENSDTDRFELEVAPGIRIAGDRWHAPGGRSAILLPGGGQTRHSWRRTAEKLAAAGYDVISMDLRGHGASSWAPGGNYGMTAFRDDLSAVVSLCDGPPVIIGASLGGLAGLLLAGETDVPVSALVLADITPFQDSGENSRIHRFMTQGEAGFESLEEVVRAVEAYRPGPRPRPANPAGLLRNLRLHEGRYFWHWDPAFVPATTAEILGRPQRLIEAARRVAVPATLLYGEKSEVVSLEAAHALKSLIPHLQLFEVAGADHMVGADPNTPFGDALFRFLEMIPS